MNLTKAAEPDKHVVLDDTLLKRVYPAHAATSPKHASQLKRVCHCCANACAAAATHVMWDASRERTSKECSKILDYTSFRRRRGFLPTHSTQNKKQSRRGLVWLFVAQWERRAVVRSGITITRKASLAFRIELVTEVRLKDNKIQIKGKRGYGTREIAAHQ